MNSVGDDDDFCSYQPKMHMPVTLIFDNALDAADYENDDVVDMKCGAVDRMEQFVWLLLLLPIVVSQKKKNLPTGMLLYLHDSMTVILMRPE